MNVSITITFTSELKPFDAPFLSTDDPRLLLLKYQFLTYFENWSTKLKTISK